MSRREQLEKFLGKTKELKNKMGLVQQEWVAHNQQFNNWVQNELGVKDVEGEMHLVEILAKWEGHDQPSKIIS